MYNPIELANAVATIRERIDQCYEKINELHESIGITIHGGAEGVLVGNLQNASWNKIQRHIDEKSENLSTAIDKARFVNVINAAVAYLENKLGLVEINNIPACSQKAEAYEGYAQATRKIKGVSDFFRNKATARQQVGVNKERRRLNEIDGYISLVKNSR